MSHEQTRVGRNPQSPGPVDPLRAILTVIRSEDPEEKGRRYELGADDAALGRDEASTIVIRSGEASRTHARIFVSGGTHILVDLDSTNGTYLNGTLVKEHTLRHGDVIRISSTELKYTLERGSRGALSAPRPRATAKGTKKRSTRAK
jgi:pSer/pThr/pTyr-binding forkhead associated (FHA) protein